MKALLLFLFLLLCQPAGAQDYEQAEQHVTDSLMDCFQNDSAFGRTLPDDKFYFQKLRDSLLAGLFADSVAREAARNGYTWPGSYFRGRAFQLGDSAPPHPTPTGWYLLAQQYGVRSRLSSGCVVRQCDVVYDYAMLLAIRRRWGADFFTRTAAEAVALDAAGAGLQLPRLQSGLPVAEVLKREFRDEDTGRRTAWGDRNPLYLIIEFSGDTITRAYLGQNFLGGIQFDIELFNPEEGLEARLQRLRWPGPDVPGPSGNSNRVL